MVSFLTSKDNIMELIFPYACLILSFLIWKVDIDSKEGIYWDKYIKELMIIQLKGCYRIFQNTSLIIQLMLQGNH